MSRFQRILVPVDFSAESQQALRYGCALARHDQAQLTVLHVVENLTPVTFGGVEAVSTIAGEYSREAQATAQAALENVAPAAWITGLSVEREVIPGSSATTIIEHARAKHSDLICIGTHGRGGVTRMLLGSVAEKIVQKASCNVLVVRRVERDFVTPDTNTLALKRILVPVDFSERGQTALLEGASLAARLQSELHLLHVIEDTSPATSEIATTSSVFQSYIRELKQSAEQQLTSLAIPGGVTASHRKVIVGAPITRITEYAVENEIDLVVMGTHGRTGALHWLMGSVAERVVRSAPCPVMVCRRTPPAPVM